MINIIFYFLAVLLAAIALAKWEIAIEGPNGWATKLPTWRLSEKHWLSKLFVAGRPLTGYHVWMFIFVIILLHLPYLYVSFSWSTELKIIAFALLMWMAEDFLWFVLNPAFGIKNFRKNKIWWHAKSWWGIAPAEFFILIPLGIILYIISFYV